MKAIVHEKYGPPDVLRLEKVPKPVPAHDEVLVEIHASAVNSGDWRSVQGKPVLIRLQAGIFKPNKRMIGADMAGRVIEVGASVTQFKVGDEVFGDLSSCGYGAFAEFVAVPESAIYFKPKNLSFLEAAAVPETGAVALYSLVEMGHVQPGQRVLVVGSSGGIGTFAVQIAKAYGAVVTAVCSMRNIELVRSLGADHVIDYTRMDFTNTGEQWDLIVASAGYHSPKEFKQALSPTGTCVVAGGDLKQLFQMMLAGKRRSEPEGRTLTYLSHHPVKDELVTLAALVEEGKLKPVINSVYPLVQVPEAIAEYGKGKSRGKIVIEIRSEA